MPSLLLKFAPTILSGIFKYFNAKKTAAGITANPKATNTGVVMAIVTIICMFTSSKGIEITPELKTNLAQIVGGLGGLYTFWRMER